VLVEVGGVRILTDPVLRTRVAHLRRHGRAPDAPRDLDAVLLSHLHHDHLDVPSLRQLGGELRLIAPRGTTAALRRAELEAEELEAGEGTSVMGVDVEAVPAVHPGRRWPVTGPSVEPLGFVIGRDPSVYFAGDTDLFPEMAAIGPVDVALLPVAGWGPRLGTGHLDPERAARAASLLEARVAIPIHWGTFHPVYARRGAWFDEPAREFETQVAAAAPGVDVRVLTPGESASFA
jgi:L-ascorbate metabolism protein UlaG (beta-lactamase superfamily)